MDQRTSIEKRYALAQEQFADLGVSTEEALLALAAIPISLHCWQGDDVTGFEKSVGGNAGILATGNYPGKARTPQELRSDIEVALSLVPGKHRVNLHAIYAETQGETDRSDLNVSHFSRWIEWALSQGLGLDFNATLFNHPHASNGFTLSNTDPVKRAYWVNHVKACRSITAEFGKTLGTPSVHNIWIPDGYKDIPANRTHHRELLKESLDQIFAEKMNPQHIVDAVESKLFGIGSESYVVGSHEFYMGYAVKNALALCLDMGHFHLTESIADKISSILMYCPALLLHISRGVRWDSDHVAMGNDDLYAVTEELVRGGYLNRTHIALDYFDASINRISAWVIGMRATQKALLRALLQPVAALQNYELQGNHSCRLALTEECSSLPYGVVWDYYCQKNNIPTGTQWMKEVRHYEENVLVKRILVPVTNAINEEKECLSDLVFVSHVLGLNAAWVQAGGGNTSVKSADGSRMYIKASGTPMSGMALERGWACVDNVAVRAMLDNKDLASLPVNERETAVAEYMMNCVVHPSTARPSVEAPLHTLLGRVVMHSHPIAANALTCSPRGEDILRSLDTGESLPALWVAFVDPGAKLAFTLHEAITEYQKKHGVPPQVIFQQNHGFFCAAQTAQECVELHERWMQRLTDYFALTDTARSADNIVSKDLECVVAIVRPCIEKAAGAEMVIRATRYRELSSAALGSTWSGIEGSLTPDHIVYAGPAALVVDKAVTESDFTRELAAYRAKYDTLPKVILIKSVGALVLGLSEKHALAAEQLAVSALQTAALSDTPLAFMTPRDIDFIVHWEVEQFRQKQMA